MSERQEMLDDDEDLSTDIDEIFDQLPKYDFSWAMDNIKNPDPLVVAATLKAMDAIIDATTDILEACIREIEAQATDE